MSTPFQTPNQSVLAHTPDYRATPAAASISAKRIVEAINHAVTRVQRFQALQTAQRAFSHDNQGKNNKRIVL
jgi:hypothetical protein